MKRLSYGFLPVLAVAATFMGATFAYSGIKALGDGERGAGVLLIAFGFFGAFLGVALWTVWRKVAGSAGRVTQQEPLDR